MQFLGECGVPVVTQAPVCRRPLVSKPAQVHPQVRALLSHAPSPAALWACHEAYEASHAGLEFTQASGGR